MNAMMTMFSTTMKTKNGISAGCRSRRVDGRWAIDAEDIDRS